MKFLKKNVYSIFMYALVVIIVSFGFWFISSKVFKFDELFTKHSDRVYVYNEAIVKIEATGEITSETRETLATESVGMGTEMRDISLGNARLVFDLVSSDEFVSGNSIADAKLLNWIDGGSGRLATSISSSTLFFDVAIFFLVYWLVAYLVGTKLVEISRDYLEVSERVRYHKSIAELHSELVNDDYDSGRLNDPSYKEILTIIETNNEQLDYYMKKNRLVRIADRFGLG